jgi:hypothetical protein
MIRDNVGFRTRVVVSLEAVRLRIRSLRQRNNVLLVVGRGARIMSAAFLTRSVVPPLSAPTIGNGPPPTSVARSHLTLLNPFPLVAEVITAT